MYRFCDDFTMAVWFLFKVFVPKKMSLKGQQFFEAMKPP